MTAVKARHPLTDTAHVKAAVALWQQFQAATLNRRIFMPALWLRYRRLELLGRV